MGLKELLGNDSGETDDESPETFGDNDESDVDPSPRRPEGKKAPKVPPARVTAKTRDEITEKLTAMLEFFALGMQLRDPYCGEALEDASEDIVRRMVAVIVKRPRWVAWFTDGADYQDWLMLATALQPVVVAFWSHHMARTAGQKTDDSADDLAAYVAPAA